MGSTAMCRTSDVAARRVFAVNAADKEVVPRGIAADLGAEGTGDTQGMQVGNGLRIEGAGLPYG